VYNWQQLNVNIPNDKLILSFKKVQQAVKPIAVQALIIIHQRLDGIKHIFHSKSFLHLLFLSCYSKNSLLLPFTSLHSTKDWEFGHMGCDIWTSKTYFTSRHTSDFN
jgi:hypothetical protein